MRLVPVVVTGDVVVAAVVIGVVVVGAVVTGVVVVGAVVTGVVVVSAIENTTNTFYCFTQNRATYAELLMMMRQIFSARFLLAISK